MKDSTEVALQRYNFNSVFTYGPGIPVTPRVNIVVNGVRHPMGVAILPAPTFNGLNLYNYLNRDFAGEYNPATQTMTIQGFY
jgi:hypothetical protein